MSDVLDFFFPRTSGGTTPLYAAAASNHMAVADLLLENGDAYGNISSGGIVFASPLAE